MPLDMYLGLGGARRVGESSSTVGSTQLGDRRLAEGELIAGEGRTQRGVVAEFSRTLSVAIAIGSHDEKGKYFGLNGIWFSIARNHEVLSSGSSANE